MTSPAHDRDVCGIDPDGTQICPACTTAASTTDADRAEAAAYWERLATERTVSQVAGLLDLSAQEVRVLVPLLRNLLLLVHQTGRI